MLEKMHSGIAKDLDKILNKTLSEINIPFKRGKRVQIGQNSLVDLKKGGFRVDVKGGGSYRTSSKLAAVALCLLPTKKQSILNLDRNLSKHYNDYVFYKTTITTSTDSEIRSIRRSRIDAAYYNFKKSKSKLESIINSNLHK